MRYYEQEHVDGYAQIRREGLGQWSDLHEASREVDDFPNRAFLSEVLPPVSGTPSPTVLEYGCGTGLAACFLASRGYAVRGVDLVPDAIALARENADRRGLAIEFVVGDVCRWGKPRQRFDVVLDSFCLQSIVLDADRARVFEGVRRRLRPEGRYVVSCAMADPRREYGRDWFDPVTGVVWTPASAPSEDAVRLDGAWYLPHRRHLTRDALAAELAAAGFEVLRQSRGGGDVVARALR